MIKVLAPSLKNILRRHRLLTGQSSEQMGASALLQPSFAADFCVELIKEVLGFRTNAPTMSCSFNLSELVEFVLAWFKKNIVVQGNTCKRMGKRLGGTFKTCRKRRACSRISLIMIPGSDYRQTNCQTPKR